MQEENYPDCGVDLIVFFGGDGTAVDIILGMREENELVPLAGVATGTACCGPFIAFRTVDDIMNHDFSSIYPTWVRGLNVYSNNQFLGTSFIDVVIGDTLVSTVDGEKSTVDAYNFFYHHKRVIKKPGYIELAGSSVIINPKNIPFGEKALPDNYLTFLGERKKLLSIKSCYRTILPSTIFF